MGKFHVCNALRIGGKNPQNQQRKHPDNGIEEDFSGDNHYIITLLVDEGDEQGIKAPADGRGQGQQVSLGVHVKVTCSVKAHQHYPQQGQCSSHKELEGKMLFFQKKLGGKGRKNRTNRNDNADVGGGGKVQGQIFRKLVQGYASETRQGKQQVFLCRQLKAARIQHPQKQIGQNKANKKNLKGRKIYQQMLGTNKGNSPKEDRKHHQQICHHPEGGIILIHGIFVHGGNNSIYLGNSARYVLNLAEIRGS